MAPEIDLLAPPKQLHLLRKDSRKGERGCGFTNENTYNKDTFDASFSFIAIC